MATDDQERQRLIAEIAALRLRVQELERAESRHERAERRLSQAHAEAVGALRETEATAQIVLESASEGIVTVDAAGRIQVVNAAAERMFGYAREELVGQPIELLLPRRLRGAHAGHRQGYFAAPRARPMGQGQDLSAQRKDGTELPVEVSLSHVDTASGRVAIAFVTDITDRKRTEAELQRQREGIHQAEKLAALGTLAAGLAHEINNPIGIISSRIELMLTELPSRTLPARLRDDLEVLQRNVRRVGQIAHGLLSFARQSPRDRGPVSLNRVVEETLLLAERQMKKAGIELRVSLDASVARVLGDAVALQQVLLNLLTNALEAMTEAGTVTIETRPAPEPPGWIQLLVADTGPGIPPDVLSKIFDPFFTTKPQGTGLGLSVSYGIVRDHGGSIDVQTDRGKGTAFTLTFPSLADPAEAPGG